MDSLIEQFLQRLDGDLSPLDAVVQQSSSEANFDPITGALRLSHRPAIGTDVYARILYPSIDFDAIERYERMHRARTSSYVETPTFYKGVLGRMNGAFLFETARFGVPSSMAQDSPRLDRSAQHPLDVGTANNIGVLNTKLTTLDSSLRADRIRARRTSDTF